MNFHANTLKKNCFRATLIERKVDVKNSAIYTFREI